MYIIHGMYWTCADYHVGGVGSRWTEWLGHRPLRQIIIEFSEHGNRGVWPDSRLCRLYDSGRYGTGRSQYNQYADSHYKYKTVSRPFYLNNGNPFICVLKQGPWYVFVYMLVSMCHDVIKWKPFPCYWPVVRGIHRWPVNSPHKGQ